MWLCYDLVWLVISLIYLPIYFFKGKLHPSILGRLGFLPKDLKLGQPLWLHAVSVGEVKAIRVLLEELRKVFPEKKVVLSTVTATGNQVAHSLTVPADFITYLPLDFSVIVRAVLAKIKPSLFIIAETEIWPNLIYWLHKADIPIVIVNGRISQRSFQGYRLLRFFLKPILNKVSLYCVQTITDARRLASLGLPEEKIKITGNMKFDTTPSTDKRATSSTDLRLRLGLKYEEKVLVAASTHSPEEEIILRAYQDLLKDFPHLRLLLAPRHPQRSKQLGKVIAQFAFPSICISQLPAQCPACIARAVFILDTIGQLVDFYSLADVVFVGGSLIKKGGQNILEPAFLGKPVLFGPHMFNFRDIAELFLENSAGIMVSDQEALRENIADLLNQPWRAGGLAQRAQALVQQNQGATQRTLDLIWRLKQGNPAML